MKAAKEYIKNHCGDIRHLFSKQDQKWWFEAMESYAESIRQEEREKREELEVKFRSFVRSFHMSRKWDDYSEEYDYERLPTGNGLDV